MRIALVTETYPPEVNGVARTVRLYVDAMLAAYDLAAVRREEAHAAT